MSVKVLFVSFFTLIISSDIGNTLRVELTQGPRLDAPSGKDLLEFLMTKAPIKQSAMNSVGLKLLMGSFFYGKITIGTPPQNFIVLFSTMFSSVWVPAKDCATCISKLDLYDSNASSTFVPLPKTPFKLDCFDGTLSGNFVTDNLAVGGANVANQTFAQIEEITGLFNLHQSIDGVVGLMTINDTKAPVKTFLQQLIEQKLISEPVFTFLVSRRERFGFINFGQNSVHKTIHYVPLIKPGIWEIHLISVSVGKDVLPQKNAPALVDIGCGIIGGPAEAIDKINKEIGAKNPFGQLFHLVDCSSIKKMPEIKFSFMNVTVTLTPEQYIHQYGFGICASPFIHSKIWILGNTLFESIGSVFDFGQNRIGFAI